MIAHPFRSGLPRPVVILGLAGIVPQAACAVLARDAGNHWFALAAACCYAALILSFLGGLWWMAALLAGRTERWIYALAVAPSLIGWAALLPWCFGWPWPGPSLVTLALVLVASPAADALLARTVRLPPGWIALRLMMAAGLGLTTLACAAA